jgi:hypothetical protein
MTGDLAGAEKEGAAQNSSPILVGTVPPARAVKIFISAALARGRTASRPS